MDSLYKLLRTSHCLFITLSTQVKLAAPDLEELRRAMEGKRRNLPYFFVRLSGKGKEVVALSAHIVKLKGRQYELHMNWFSPETDPPDDFGDWGAVEHVFARLVRGPADVRVQFKYDPEKYRSLFLPVDVKGQSILFDEVVELTAVKRGTDGKPVYELEISTRGGGLRHAVSFSQEVSLTSELPVQLITNAQRLSELALSHVN